MTLILLFLLALESLVLGILAGLFFGVAMPILITLLGVCAILTIGIVLELSIVEIFGALMLLYVLHWTGYITGNRFAHRSTRQINRRTSTSQGASRVS